MRINGIQCDQCKKQHLIAPDFQYQSYEDFLAPEWFMLGRKGRGQEPLVFCGKGCLSMWLQENTGDWDKLSSEQADAIEALSYKMHEIMKNATKEFYKQYPGLRVDWGFKIAHVKIEQGE
jgi:hypothetical protein